MRPSGVVYAIIPRILIGGRNRTPTLFGCTCRSIEIWCADITRPFLFSGGAVKKGKIIETDRRKRSPLKKFFPFFPPSVLRDCGNFTELWGDRGAPKVVARLTNTGQITARGEGRCSRLRNCNFMCVKGQRR